MAHFWAQLVLLLLVALPAPVTFEEMSDWVGAVSYTVALVSKATFRLSIFLPWHSTTTITAMMPWNQSRSRIKGEVLLMHFSFLMT